MATTPTTKLEYHLIGTYSRYSSWTARVEAILEYFNIPYTVTNIPLLEVKEKSPTGLVPVLKWRDIYIGESLSIAEFLAESHPEKNLWPKDKQLRALARSAAAEMHSGFSALRNTYATNFVAKYEGKIPVGEEAKREVERVLNIWSEARKSAVKILGELGEVDEGFLFGAFSIADAFFWPVLWRFRSYNLPLDTAPPEALKWMGKMWSDPVFKRLGKEYFRQAEMAETRVEKYDDIFKGNEDVKYGKFSEEWGFQLGG